jgi:hypothetical protein
MEILQREPGRTVAMEAGGQAVRKTFHGHDPVSLKALAAREFDRMQVFRQALDGIESATCPRPLELGDAVEPYVRMERARGVPLQDHLASHTWDAPLFDHVSGVLEHALTRYIETFGEPYWDFIFRNMFYDPNLRLVTFLDFGVPTIYMPALDEFRAWSDVEVSLGSLVASSLFEAARPRRMTRRREHRQAVVLAGQVLRCCAHGSETATPRPEGVRGAALTAYGLACGQGGRVRRRWYRHVGAILARPSRALDRLGLPDA